MQLMKPFALFVLIVALAAPVALAASVVYVDDDYAGSDPDWFVDIQPAIDAVDVGGTVNVYPGTYDRDVAYGRDPLTGGAGSNDFNIFIGKSLTLQGVDAGGAPITDYSDVAAFVSAMQELPTFGQSAIFVAVDDVTITGLDVTGWPGTENNKTLESSGDNLVVKYCQLHALDSASSLYICDRHFDASGSGLSHIQYYRIEGNLIDGGGIWPSGIRISSGPGWGWPTSDRVIAGNTFDNYCDGIAFVGPGADPWDDYPVGAATITGNTFGNADRRHVIAWGQYAGAQGYVDPDWAGILSSNTFDKATCIWTPGGAVRYWDYAPQFYYVKGLYAGPRAIMRYAVPKAQAGDIVQLLPGIYEEQVEIAKALTLDGSDAEATIIRSPVSLPLYFETPNAYPPPDMLQNHPVVYVHDADDVVIRDLTVDGYGRANGNYRMDGVAYYNAGGAIDLCKVMDVRETPLSGNQHGVGIYAYTDTSTPRTLAVMDCEVYGYQKNGMALFGESLTATVTGCDVTGAGPLGSGLPAQNGIQYGVGASGAITGCLVQDHMYTPATWAATGVLLDGAGPVAVTNCTLEDNFPSVYCIDTDADLSGLRLHHAHTYSGDGIYMMNSTSALRAESPRPVAAPLDAGKVERSGGRGLYEMTVDGSVIEGHGAAYSWGMGAFGTGTQTAELTVTNSVVTNWDVGVIAYYNPTYEYTAPTAVSITGSSIVGNSTYGVENQYTAAVLDAEDNYWGSATGPGPVGPGSGDRVSNYVDFDPYRTGNIVFIPDPEYFTTTGTKTLTVRYLGGASGLLYSWQILMNGWTGSIVDAVAADVQKGDTNWEVFFPQDTANPDEIRISGSLVGGHPGLTGPCDLFRVTFHGASMGRCYPALTATYFRDRDFNNLTGVATDPGDLIVVGPAPAVSVVALTNVTLTNTDDYCKNGDVLGLTATVTPSGDPLFGTANITADLSVLGGGAAVHPTSWDPGTKVATWADFAVNDASVPAHSETVTVTATDGAGQIGTGSDAIILDNVPPSAVTVASAAPGHKKVTLAWTNGADTYYDGVEIRYNVWQGSPYWLYQYTSDPGYPADQNAGTHLWDGTGTGYLHTFVTYDRGIYEYTIVARDMARNYSTPVGDSKARATNYWLGDVSPLPAAYDGRVNTGDISTLSNTYYNTSNLECDVAQFGNPNNPRGIPAPDGAVDFEDLMIFALNFGVVTPLMVPPFTVPDVPRDGEVALSIQLPDAMSPGSEFEARVMLSDADGVVQGARFVVTYDANVVEYLGSRPGSLVQGIQNLFFMPVMVEGQPDISAAALGEGVTFGHSGELAKVRFRVVGEGTISLGLRGIVARNSLNEDLLAGSSDVVEGPGEVKLPTEVFLHSAQPNPFGGATTLSYGLPEAAPVKLAVYDVSGRLVRVLAEGQQSAGEHPVLWDGRDEAGSRVATGLYLYRLETQVKTITRKMIVTE